MARLNNLIPKQKPTEKKPTSPIFITQEDKRRSLEKLNERLRFSWYYLDIEHEAFCCGGVGPEWFISLHEVLREVSKLSFNELIAQREHYDSHLHDWKKLDYRFNIPGHVWEQISENCMQFRLSKSNGRVHGFVIGNTFYIVWLDPHHNLYPSDKHGGRKILNPYLTPYEIAKQEADYFKQELAVALDLLDEKTKPDS